MSYEKAIANLDKWTNVSLEAYWKEIVKEYQQASATGKTDTQETAPSGA